MRISSQNSSLAIAAHSLVNTSILELAGAPLRESLIMSRIFAQDYDDYLDELVESRVEANPAPIEERNASLDNMIIKSICSVTQTDLRKKLANCILLTGGSSMFPELVEVLEERLI